MEEYEEQYDELFMEAYTLPNDSEKIELIEQMVAWTDRHNDLPRGYESRQLLMNTALETGDSDKLLVAFSWCASMSAKRPELFDGNEILWAYRWVVSELPNFPDVSRDKIEAMMAEMESSYRAAGSQLRAFYLMKMFTYAKMGDEVAAEQSLRLYEPAPRDWLSDTPRLEQNFLVFFYATFGNTEKAFKLSENVIRGHVDDPGFFGQDSAELLMPLLKQGRVADAIRVQKKGYPFVAEHSSWLWNIAQHVEFLARIDDFNNAIAIINEHLGFALRTPRMIYRFFFLRSMWIVNERVTRENSLYMREYDRVLRKFPTFRNETLSLSDRLWNEITELAERFDQRNGNDFFTQHLTSAKTASVLPNPTGSAS